MSGWDRGADLLSSIRSGEWLDSQTFPDLAWAVPGIIPEGFGLLVGPPKLGKSWMALHLGLACSTGSNAFGAISTGRARPVLYLALEDGERRLQDRCRKLLKGAPIPTGFHFATHVGPGLVLPTLAAWLEMFGEETPLVVLDTLGRVMPPATPGESAYARDYRVGSQLKALPDAHPGATVLVVHHTRKAEGVDWMDSTSGTQGLNGSADFTIALGRSRNESEAVLRVTGRDVRENEFAMTSEDGVWALAGKSLGEAARAALAIKASAGLKDKASNTVAVVNAHPEGIRAADVAAAVVGLDVDQARVYLSRLHAAGRIGKAQQGLYTPVSPVSGVTDDVTGETHETPCAGCGVTS